MADIWDDRVRALDTLKSSVAYVKRTADDIDKDADTAAENIPQRFAGFVEALTRYQKTIQDLWSVLYSADELRDAQAAETPQLKLPPHMSMVDGIPYVQGGTGDIPTGVNVWDSEAPVLFTQSTTPGTSRPGQEINLSWFGNLANKLNNYIPQSDAAWKEVWGLIREGYGAISGRNIWLAKEVKVGAIPSPTIATTPPPTHTLLEKGLGASLPDPIKIVIHEQTFTYGYGEVFFRVYKMDKLLIFEIEIFANDAHTSLPTFGEVIGQTIVDDKDIQLADGIKTPILHKTQIENSVFFEYGLVDLLISVDKDNVLTLSLTGTDISLCELACNCTYTVPVFTEVDTSWQSLSGGIWKIEALAKDNYRQYFVEYSEDNPPTPPVTGGIGLDNISEVVFGEIVAKRFVLSTDPSRDPTSYTGTPITFDNIAETVMEEVVIDRMVLESGDPVAPTTVTKKPLVYETLSSAVLPIIRATKITLGDSIKTTYKKVEENPLDYDFYFVQGEINFSPTTDDKVSIPEDMMPNRYISWMMHGNDPYGAVDVRLELGESDNQIYAYGLYAYDGEKEYKVHNYTKRRGTFTSIGNPVWYKEADRYILTVYREQGAIVYSFVANYTDQGLDSWPDGIYDLVSFGEMPRNLNPLHDVIMQIGKSAYLIIQQTGMIKLTVARSEKIVEKTEYTLVYPADPDDKRILQTYDILIPTNNPTERFDAPMTKCSEIDIKDIYSWPTCNVRKLQLNRNNGDCFAFMYQTNNLRMPIYDPDGQTVINTVEGIELLAGMPEARVKLGDGALMRIINTQRQKIEGFNADQPTGDIVIYMVMCQFEWARPKIKYVKDTLASNQTDLENIKIQKDGISAVKYFTLMRNYANATVSLLNTASTTLKEMENMIYGNIIDTTAPVKNPPIRTVIQNYL